MSRRCTLLQHLSILKFKSLGPSYALLGCSAARGVEITSRWNGISNAGISASRKETDVQLCNIMQGLWNLVLLHGSSRALQLATLMLRAKHLLAASSLHIRELHTTLPGFSVEEGPPASLPGNPSSRGREADGGVCSAYNLLQSQTILFYCVCTFTARRSCT